MISKLYYITSVLLIIINLYKEGEDPEDDQGPPPERELILKIIMAPFLRNPIRGSRFHGKGKSVE